MCWRPPTGGVSDAPPVLAAGAEAAPPIRVLAGAGVSAGVTGSAVAAVVAVAPGAPPIRVFRAGTLDGGVAPVLVAFTSEGSFGDPVVVSEAVRGAGVEGFVAARGCGAPLIRALRTGAAGVVVGAGRVLTGRAGAVTAAGAVGADWTRGKPDTCADAVTPSVAGMDAVSPGPRVGPCAVSCCGRGVYPAMRRRPRARVPAPPWGVSFSLVMKLSVLLPDQQASTPNEAGGRELPVPVVSLGGC
jgi:hypothetical protein